MNINQYLYWAVKPIYIVLAGYSITQYPASFWQKIKQDGIVFAVNDAAAFLHKGDKFFWIMADNILESRTIEKVQTVLNKHGMVADNIVYCGQSPIPDATIPYLKINQDDETEPDKYFVKQPYEQKGLLMDTSFYAAVSLAYIMGAKLINLIGNDCGYYKGRIRWNDTGGSTPSEQQIRYLIAQKNHVDKLKDILFVRQKIDLIRFVPTVVLYD